MPSPVRLYQREMHSNLGYFATWLPADAIEVGDVGILEAGRFRRMLSLQELGISCDVTTSRASQTLQYTSTQGTAISMSAGGTALATIKAEITIDFSREGAFVFHASNLQAQGLANRSSVGEQIVNAYKQDKWIKEWLLVEALHVADRATIIVSEDSSAGLVLTASAETPISAISLADPKIALTVASTRGKIVHIVGGRRLSPLYSCLRLRAPLFGAPAMHPVRGAGGDIPLERPSIDDLLAS